MTEPEQPKMVRYPAGAAAIEERFRILREHDDHGDFPVTSIFSGIDSALAVARSAADRDDLDPVDLIRLAALLLVAADRIIVPLEERR